MIDRPGARRLGGLFIVLMLAVNAAVMCFSRANTARAWLRRVELESNGVTHFVAGDGDQIVSEWHPFGVECADCQWAAEKAQ